MSQDEIIATAKEAGFFLYDLTETHGIKTVESDAPDQWAQLARFAALVAEKAAAKEREACAVLLENLAANLFAECPPSDRENFAAACKADFCADLVRARGKP